MDLLDYDQLSKRLSVKKSTLYSWVSQNKIPYVRFSGRCVRFNIEAITSWLNRKSEQAGRHE
jgi:excisionase family DNA binding protein